MSEEDAFLAGIAGDRADRTRLLVFADWLADRSDPREGFVRLHARLLDLDGSEPEFAELNEQWSQWTDSPLRPDCMPNLTGRLPDQWLDALCRVCTSSDLEALIHADTEAHTARVERAYYGHGGDDDEASSFDSLTLYRGSVADCASPGAFVAATALNDIRQSEFVRADAPLLASCYPLTRGAFCRLWRERCAALRGTPSLSLNDDALFLAAQYFSGGWSNWGIVAAYQFEYFALFWSTTD